MTENDGAPCGDMGFHVQLYGEMIAFDLIVLSPEVDRKAS
jgi:hypothetical protein